MIRRFVRLVRRLPRAGDLRLYVPPDRPCLLPGERLIADLPEAGLPRHVSWIVEPVPGRAAAVERQYWHLVGRWVWAAQHLAGRCECDVSASHVEPLMQRRA
jgi:hypothetical protein